MPELEGTIAVGASDLCCVSGKVRGEVTLPMSQMELE